MALYSLRLRRGLTATVSTLHRSFFTVPAISSPPTPISTSSASSSQSQTLSFLLLQSRQFRSSPLLSSIRKSKFEPTEEIGPDSILFEGCDYNHWLITMEFPKDPAPSPEEMVATYEKTCAAGLGISLEEAKKRMYACSTTTYVGFQAVMTEEESEKFRGVPGVVFILPDSYIDPQNKEYGGDKYDNGHITPRPPPFQYNNRQRGRYNDQNRSGDRGLRPNQQRDSAYQGYTQGDGRTNAVPLNYPPQQNYAPGVRDNYQVGRRDPMPSYQGNPNQAQQNNFYPQERRDFPQGDRQNYAPSGQRDFSGDNRNYAPRNDGNFQGPAGQYGQQGGRAYGQGANSEYPGHGGQSFPQMDQRNAQGDQRSYAPIGQTGTYQMDQRNVQGEQRNYPPVGQTGTYQMDQRNAQEDQRNYTPMGQTGTYQGR